MKCKHDVELSFVYDYEMDYYGYQGSFLFNEIVYSCPKGCNERGYIYWRSA